MPATVLALSAAAPAVSAQNAATFTCGSTKSAVPLSAQTIYTGGPGKNFGWDMHSAPTEIANGACSGDKPFFFSLAEGNGNYQVTVDLGGPAASNITVKAEARRIMVYQAAIAAGGSQTFTFNVNIRLPNIPNGDPVKLKPREIGTSDFFGKGIVISNHAESGETIKSFTGERRFAKIFSTLKKGDFLLIQFAHNDQKSGSGFVSIDEYKHLIRTYEAQAKERGAAVILVTAMNRRTFDDTGHIKQSLGDYPQAMRDVAAEDHLGLIDLNNMSKQLFEAMGPQGTVKAFVHYPANTFPSQPEELRDDTHFNAYGAYELARCIVQSIRDQNLPLAPYLAAGTPAFDPAHPDPLSTFAIPPSPFASSDTPYGR